MMLIGARIWAALCYVVGALFKLIIYIKTTFAVCLGFTKLEATFGGSFFSKVFSEMRMIVAWLIDTACGFSPNPDFGSNGYILSYFLGVSASGMLLAVSIFMGARSFRLMRQVLLNYHFSHRRVRVTSEIDTNIAAVTDATYSVAVEHHAQDHCVCEVGASVLGLAETSADLAGYSTALVTGVIDISV